MAKGVNKVILIGNVGGDPEIRYMPNGNAAASFTVATSESWKDKQTGEAKERTEWHRITGFNRLAEIMGEYLKKGSKVYIEGSLRTRKWQGQDGQDRYTTEIVASEMQMLDSKNANERAVESGQQVAQQRQQQAPQQQRQAPQQQNRPTNGTQQSVTAPQQTTQYAPNFDEFDDDIAF